VVVRTDFLHTIRCTDFGATGVACTTSCTSAVRDHARVRCAILGPGAIGVLAAARLADAGHDVVLLARERTAAALLVDGIRLRRGEDELRAAPTVHTALPAPVDLVVIAVKATGLLPALQRCAPAAVGDALVVPLLNGVDHVALLRVAYPAARVVPAAIRVSVTLSAPGEATQHSPSEEVILSEGRDGDAVADLLGGAGFPIERAPDEAHVLWGKLCVLAPIALACTAERAPLGVLRERRPERLARLAEEVSAAAATAGVTVGAGRILEHLAALPGQQRPSMLVDRLAGAEPELEAIAGPILRAPTGTPPVETAAVVREILRG
jgi:2-dehydropantoate 2-reductase